jgi:hypothetical protein
MVISAPPGIFRDPDASARVSQWLAADATTQERAACSYLLRLVSHSLPKSAQQGEIGGGRPGTAPRPGSANWARNVSRPSSASGPGGARKPSSHPQRPSTAAPRTQPGHQGPSLQHSIAHEKYNLRPRTSSGPSSQTTEAGEGYSAMPRNPWTTTNDVFYGFRSQHPEIFNEVEAATRVSPAGHLTFLSEYAESMKLGGKNWKQYLKTTTETVNRSVFPPNLEQQVCDSWLLCVAPSGWFCGGIPVYATVWNIVATFLVITEWKMQVAKDKGFFSWMKRQRASASAA